MLDEMGIRRTWFFNTAERIEPFDRSESECQ
jgi:hypothetical protein